MATLKRARDAYILIYSTSRLERACTCPKEQEMVVCNLLDPGGGRTLWGSEPDWTRINPAMPPPEAFWELSGTLGLGLSVWRPSGVAFRESGTRVQTFPMAHDVTRPPPRRTLWLAYLRAHTLNLNKGGMVHDLLSRAGTWRVYVLERRYLWPINDLYIMKRLSGTHLL